MFILNFPDNNSFAEGKEGPERRWRHRRGYSSLHGRSDDHGTECALRNGEGDREGVRVPPGWLVI